MIYINSSTQDVVMFCYRLIKGDLYKIYIQVLRQDTYIRGIKCDTEVLKFFSFLYLNLWV